MPTNKGAKNQEIVDLFQKVEPKTRENMVPAPSVAEWNSLIPAGAGWTVINSWKLINPRETWDIRLSLFGVTLFNLDVLWGMFVTVALLGFEFSYWFE